MSRSGEMVDTKDLKSFVRKDVGVRVPPSAQKIKPLYIDTASHLQNLAFDSTLSSQ